MSERKLYVCTQCHEFWSSAKPAVICPSCGSPVCLVEQDYAEYASWTAEEKAAFKARYVAQHDLQAEVNAYVRSQSSASTATPEAKDGDFWINWLDTALNIMLGLFIFLAVVIFIGMAVSGGAGVLIGLVAAVTLILVGLLTVAGMKIFINMAKDVKAIRQKMDA